MTGMGDSDVDSPGMLHSRTVVLAVAPETIDRVLWLARNTGMYLLSPIASRRELISGPFLGRRLGGAPHIVADSEPSRMAITVVLTYHNAISIRGVRLCTRPGSWYLRQA